MAIVIMTERMRRGLRSERRAFCMMPPSLCYGIAARAASNADTLASKLLLVGLGV
jgi:hypothetical protein